MIRIGIDARLYFKTGCGVYLRNLLFYLQKITYDKFTFFVYVNKKDSKKIIFTKKNFIKREIISSDYNPLKQKNFFQNIQKDKLDLMHFTHFIHPVQYTKKYIATVHDITPLFLFTDTLSKEGIKFAKKLHTYFSLSYFFQIKNASLIITPTNTIKEKIISLYKIPQRKIISIYEGVNYELLELSSKINVSVLTLFKQKLKKLGIKKNFFIYVGNFYPHKNIHRLIYAFYKIKKNIQLVLVSPKSDYSKYINQLINNLNLRNKIILYKNASNLELSLFYKTAKGLIFPSLSEGFGLPIIEASYFNCPIIASNIKVFKEILGNKYVSFNPYKVSDIIDKINYFLEKNPKFNYQKILKKYSFKNMTKKILNLYKKLV
jgi:glycosyltransferase involved in cell wall biosynthesis